LNSYPLSAIRYPLSVLWTARPLARPGLFFTAGSRNVGQPFPYERREAPPSLPLIADS
jgi:hypothetical protein